MWGDGIMAEFEPDTADATLPRLRQEPDWFYLLREYYELYRRSSAGGSRLIRMHQRSVRETISKVMDEDPPVSFQQPMTKPVSVHMKRALDNGRLGAMAPIIRAIDNLSGQLSWLYGYDTVPRHLLGKFAYAEIVGPNGPVVSNRLILGLVLFAPRCVYPTHSHDGLTESYFCLSGSVSENDDGVYAPGSMIFNPPGREHRITVDAREPCLLAYAWAGAPDKLANQKMKFSRSRKAGGATATIK